jgi:hypothetical protein
LFLLLLATSSAYADNDTGQSRARVLVLGMVHLSNPGRDLSNVQVDDVLAPKRQRELTQLIYVLKRFRTTKIAIEASCIATV